MARKPTSVPWGKIIGGVLGLMLGGPWGAFLGLVVGHRHDSAQRQAKKSGLWAYDAAFGGSIEQTAFTVGVVVLSAKMAKADGRVTRAEIDAFKKVFNIASAQESAIGALFDRARRSADGFEPYALQLAHIYRRNPAVLEEILGGLLIIAASDSVGLTPAEILFLKRVAAIFGFDSGDVGRIAARSGVTLPEMEKPPDAQSESYAILGINETASAEEIKAAYRALIREHHPDRLMAQGVPPEFIATATEKMKRINVAYDTVCKIKGMK